jgi:hypothetical protein
MHRCLPAPLLLALLVPAMLLHGAPALARKAEPPPLPPLVLPAAAPLVAVEIAGQQLRLTVDFGGDDIVQINPGHPIRALLAGEARPDGEAVERGRYRVAVGQTSLSIAFSREQLGIAGRTLRARVLLPDAPPPGQPAGSDGSIGLPLLPHDSVTLAWRPASAADRRLAVPARIGRSDAWGFDWPLPGGSRLDVELHTGRALTVASAAAASDLAAAGNGRLVGAVQRVPISFGAIRPVRMLELAQPVRIANVTLARAAVRLFDWAGSTALPPDADAEDGLAAVGRRGRQGAWRNVKLGADVLAGCASISWQRQPAELALTCPMP